MKKLIIFGSNGLLGQALVERFCGDYKVICASLEPSSYCSIKDLPYNQIDMINRSEISEFLTSERPDIIVNAAAFTDVDACETEKEICWNTNVRAVENIIDAADLFKPILIHISTDYVFDGIKGNYTESDETNPLGNYARSKMAAENIVKSSNLEYIIARTQVLYGYANKAKLNFATWVISRLTNNKEIKVVTDQVGNPTYIEDLAEGLFLLLNNDEFGLFHICGSESIDRYNFALKIAQIFKLNESLIKQNVTADLNQIAPRPMNSTFMIDKLINRTDWQPGDIESGLLRLKAKLKKHNG
jgi:dTDP-4-dehydrorhamnose reductase